MTAGLPEANTFTTLIVTLFANFGLDAPVDCLSKQLRWSSTSGRREEGILLSHGVRILQSANLSTINQSINQSKRKTSNANGQTNLGHKHKAPDHNHEATQPMVDLPHTS